tara:strand:+ start:117 stop:419 length:303 start_codon:yes stop_codon:yes gene_type:complete
MKIHCRDKEIHFSTNGPNGVVVEDGTEKVTVGTIEFDVVNFKADVPEVTVDFLIGNHSELFAAKAFKKSDQNNTEYRPGSTPDPEPAVAPEPPAEATDSG